MVFEEGSRGVWLSRHRGLEERFMRFRRHGMGKDCRCFAALFRLRGAMLPIVSYLAPCAAALLTGSAVVETIFTIPGVGRYFVLGALNRDYPLVMGTVILVAVFVIVFNLLVDIAYGLLDPRVRND